MPGYVLLRSEKGSDLTPDEADTDLGNLYNFKAEKTDLEAVEERTTVLETSQSAQDMTLSSLNDRTTTLEASQTDQDTELADHEARLDVVEAGLANHGHDAADITFTPSGDLDATNVQVAIEELDADKQGVDQRGQPDGYPPLDASGKIPLDFLPGVATSNKGYFATEPELVAAYPTASAGDYAIVGTTDTVWTWDEQSAAWVNTDARSAVDSVNGKIGTVVLEAQDIPFTPVTPFTATEAQTAIEQARSMADARWIDRVPVEMDGALDGYLLKVTGTPGNETVVAVPGVSAGIPASAVRRYMDSTTEIINGATYYQVKSAPPAPATAPVTAVNAGTGAGVFNLITQFVSNAQTEQLQIQEGLWAFRLWLQASNANCTLVAQVSSLNTDTFVKTVIHNASWPVPDISLQQFAFDFEQPTPITLEPNERIVVELMCFSPAAGRTLTLTFDGVDRQSYVDVPLALQHNSLSGLQGGNGSERFHLSAAEHAELLSRLANPRVAVERFTSSGTFVKPAGARLVKGVVIGGGGGGASGSVNVDSQAAQGGGGGGGGGRTEFELDAASMPASCAVTVGIGGLGGVASAGGFNNGGSGGTSSVFVGSVGYNARGGNSGSGPTGASGIECLFSGGFGGAGGSTTVRNGLPGRGTVTSVTGSNGGGGPGGGGGGALLADNSEGQGGSSSFSTVHNASAVPGGSGGSPGGGHGLDAATSPGYSTYLYPGVSGGGGGANQTGNGGNGGNGGGFGAGGGGGGAARTGFTSGRGGNGSPGVVLFFIYYD